MLQEQEVESHFPSRASLSPANGQGSLHFLVLVNLLFLLLIELHDLHPLSLHQTPFLDVELLLGLKRVTNNRDTKFMLCYVHP